MKNQRSEQEKENVPQPKNEQQAIQEISAIREAKNDKGINRVKEFELAHEGVLVSGHDVWSLKEAKETDEYNAMIQQEEEIDLYFSKWAQEIPIIDRLNDEPNDLER